MLPGYPPSEQFLRASALDALRGVGNATLGQWEEWTGRFYHIKRRLTFDEQPKVGNTLDVRGTPEALKRRMAVQRYLPIEMQNWEE